MYLFIQKLLIAYILLFVACKQNANSSQAEKQENISENLKTIDLASNFKLENEKMKLSDVVSNVEYIKLETTDESVIPNAVRLKTTDKYILVSDWVFEYIYLFNKEGKFIRKIGQLGQGPRQYRLGISYTANDSIAYIQTNWLGKIMKYRLSDNSFAGEIPAKNTKEIYLLPNNNIVAVLRAGNDIKKIFTALIMNNKGDTIAYKKPYINIERIQKSYPENYLGELISWQTKGQICIYEFNNDTIYSIRKSEIKPRYVLKLGKYKMPEEIFYSGQNRFKEEEKYFTIRGFTECENFLYIRFSYQGDTNSWFAQYNKKNENIKFWKHKINPSYGSGCYNDIDGGPMVIARTDKENHTWSPITYEMGEEYLTPEHFAKMEVLFPEKKAELQNLLKSMKEDDNPIIVLYKLK